MTSLRNFQTWLVYSACCLVAFLDFAIILTFGTLFVNLLEKYRENRSATATVQSLLIGTTTTSSVICGILIKKLGVTWSSVIGTLFLSFGFIFSFFATKIVLLDALIGVLAGIGISLLYVSSAVVVRNSFDGTAREIALSGHTIAIGIGAIVYPYILSLLEGSYGVNGTLLILGGLYLNNIAVVLVFYSHENCDTHKKYNEKTVAKESTNQEQCDENNRATKGLNMYRGLSNLWKKAVELMKFNYTLVLIGSTILLSSLNGYLIVFDDILASKGFSSDDILKQFTSFNVGSTAARALPIILSKTKPGADHVLLLILFSISGCTGQLIIHFATNMALAFPGNILSGMAAGGGTSAAIVVIGNITSEELFGVAFGLFLTIMGVLTFSLGPLYGILSLSLSLGSQFETQNVREYGPCPAIVVIGNKTSEELFGVAFGLFLTFSLGPLYGYIRDSIQSYHIAMFLTVGLNAFAALLFTATVLKNICQARNGRKRKYTVETVANTA